MDLRFWIGMLGVLLTAIAGCSSSTDQTEVPVRARIDDPANATGATAQRNSSTDAMLVTVRGFLDAVLEGDSQRATELLTPLAIERIQADGKTFLSLPGLETASYRIGEVRPLSEAQAFVQCFLSDSSSDGTTQEEMCCLLKSVEGNWRVAGIAFQIPQAKAPFLLDFEKPAGSGPAQQQMAADSQGELEYFSDSDDQVPVRTAQQSSNLNER